MSGVIPPDQEARIREIVREEVKAADGILFRPLDGGPLRVLKGGRSPSEAKSGPAARSQIEPWRVALQALTRAAVIRGQSRPDASPEDLERDLYALEEAVCILRERA